MEKRNQKKTLNYREQIDGEQRGGSGRMERKKKRKELGHIIISICSLGSSPDPIHFYHSFPACGFKCHHYCRKLWNQVFPTQFTLCPHFNCLFGINHQIFPSSPIPLLPTSMKNATISPMANFNVINDSPSLSSYVISKQNPIDYTDVLSLVDASQ